MSFAVRSAQTGMGVPYGRPQGRYGFSTPAKTKVGAVLTLDPPAYTGGGTVTPTYRWQVKTAAGVISDLAAGGNPTTVAYTLQAAEETKFVRCRVTLTDSVYGAGVYFTEWSSVVLAVGA